MASEAFVQCRVTQATKAALRAVANRQQLPESALLKRALELVLQTAAGTDARHVIESGRLARQARLYVRLTTEDRQLLAERSAARCLAPATYASTLLRAHLRSLAPMPAEELRALRRSTRELAALGRNLNQIAHAAHRGDTNSGPGREDLRNILRACEALRVHVRTYISTNLSSWSSGDAT